MIDEKSWTEFRATGLLWFVNQTLQLFGWSLVYDTTTGAVCPARTRFRGFSDDVISEGYQKVSQYMLDNADTLLKESKE